MKQFVECTNIAYMHGHLNNFHEWRTSPTSRVPDPPSHIELMNVDIDIIAVTETLKTTLNAQYLAINNYKKVSNLRTDGKKEEG